MASLCCTFSRHRQFLLTHLRPVFHFYSPWKRHKTRSCYGDIGLKGVNQYNTRVYNLISVPQITQVSLEDAIISSKTELANGSKNENRSYGEVRNNKKRLKILSLIGILYLKQQSNILLSFYRLFSNKFRVLCFAVRWWFIQLKRSKYNILLKIS